MQDVFLISNKDGVAGIVAALGTHHNIGIFG